MEMPVHARRLAVEHLHSIKSHVAAAGARIARKNHRKRDEGPAVSRPAREHRQNAEIGITLDDLLAGAIVYKLRRNSSEPDELREQVQLFLERSRWFALNDFLDFARDVLEIVDSQRHRHPFG